jgi:hypothetical protein
VRGIGGWWAALDSNQRPLACQALPTERCTTSVEGRAKRQQLYDDAHPTCPSACDVLVDAGKRQFRTSGVAAGNDASTGGANPATKRLTAVGLRPRFVLRIAGIGPIESHSESHARRPWQVWGRASNHTHRRATRVRVGGSIRMRALAVSCAAAFELVPHTGFSVKRLMCLIRVHGGHPRDA